MTENSWAAMTYDEQRSALGLPDVASWVAWDRITRVGRQLAERWRGLWNSTSIIEPDADDYTLAGER